MTSADAMTRAEAQQARDLVARDVMERLRQAREIPVSRDDVAEEPVSKAFENRVRTAFLATKGATMVQWLSQRETLLAQAAIPGPV